jgi:hypothetical protein
LYGFYYLEHELKRENTLPLLSIFSLLFILLWYWAQHFNSLTNIFLLGVLSRAIFIFHIPEFSQDFYRFIWDGSIQLLGVNPYIYTPKVLISYIYFPNAQLLYESMGYLSAGNFSNYPPLSQYLYQIMGYFNKGDLLYPVLSLRIIYFTGEIIVFFLGTTLLKKINQNPEHILWYFLNPLVIIEGIGNLHGEAFMICFTLASILCIFHKKVVLGGLFMALAIAAKLLPLLIVPLFFRFLDLRKFIFFILYIFIFSLILWYPFWEEQMVSNYRDTINLWFTTFEFNGSIYNIVRSIGYEVKGYNIIRKLGKITPFITVGLVFIFTFLRSNRDLKSVLKSILFLLSSYFFIATTVHPWYIINLVILGVLTGYVYPILWSLTVFWSYSAYGSEEFKEELIWTLPAYLLVYTCFVYEIIKGALGEHLQKTNFFRV